jgi:hypothetical protein
MIDAWRRSGLTLNEFALQHGTTEQRLGHWRKRFEKRKPSPPVTFAPATTLLDEVSHVRAVVQADGVTIAFEGATADYIVEVARALTRPR